MASSGLKTEALCYAAVGNGNRDNKTVLSGVQIFNLSIVTISPESNCVCDLA